MKIKIDQKLIDDGYINCRKHPTFDYYIYNYSCKTQFEQMWCEDTLRCRGLILDKSGEVIAMSFNKFFNYGEYQQDSYLGILPSYKTFEAYDKADGSLGISYQLPNGEYRIATRGSFESPQAIEGTKILHEMMRANTALDCVLNSDYTYLFEIIYPENRIVVDYKGKRDLILLTAINRKTGLEIPMKELEILNKEKFGFSIVKKYEFNNDLNTLRVSMEEGEKIGESSNSNKEGYVIKFDHGLRIKIKYEEYCRLHKLITGVNSKTIWELLKEGKSTDELLDRVPDEFYNWVKETSEELINSYDDIEDHCLGIIGNMRYEGKDNEDRKMVAQYFMENKPYQAILFNMYDGKPYGNIIWKILRPSHAKAFSEDI